MSSVQGRHNIAQVTWSYREKPKVYYRQVPYHAYSTYIQTSNQAIREKNQSKRAQTTAKPRKTVQKWKKFHKNMCKKVI